MPEHDLHRVGRVAWRQVDTGAGTVSYGAVGQGPLVVFLHGWGLTPRSYTHALRQVAAHGRRVFAPALPGFGGTAELPPGERSFVGYAHWLERFLDSIGIDEPVTIVGHSFGGGVAIAAAHEFSSRVSQLVLVNAVGGGAWSTDDNGARPIHERPLWKWGAAAVGEAFAVRSVLGMTATIADCAISNVLGNPGAFWRVGHLARTADFTAELEQLVLRRVPIALLWGLDDRIIPEASFQSMRSVLTDSPVITVPGAHSWLIDDPERFGTAMKTAFDKCPQEVLA
ncbi:alpha/beta fold hydrolase [Rhodococcus sp. IEGM 1379]|uniref:alpha/beta fold hydrolase n=1 Tax=Rhodococcus sp. IEGM 1379 TaxID=3047086 RepID=UPI0024B7F206|nr:alpha/beta fold hydrolase [Rhodococcus sp. IEGM 1379]MDI9914437.1 alpha/beta fold hydrolase [Rhodococcus sp. IEGM 1379]